MSNSIKLKKATHKLKILGLAGLLATSAINQGCSTNIKKDPIETVNKEKLNTPQKTLDKTYKITDRESFDKLWNDAKPLCVPVLILSENWRLDFHHDQGKKSTPNSVLAGLYYYPTNGDFTSNDWDLTKNYCENYKKTHKNNIPPNRKPSDIRDGIYGWCASMENGRHLKELYNALKGTELTINEFAAIYSHYFHTGNLDATRKIASIKKSKEIKNKSLKGAQALLDTDPITLNGRKNRFMHEALVYLNTDNYCNDLFSLCVDCHLGTSINACPDMFDAVCDGKLTNKKAQEIKDTICSYTVKNGKQIKYLCKQINDTSIMAFCIETETSKKLDERDAIYQKALVAYNQNDYETAKTLFIQVIEKRGAGPDLWNDMAITYSKLGEHANCIEMCRKVLSSGTNKEYAKACFNAGKSYEAEGNYEKALQNYRKALEYYNKYGIANKDINVNYDDIYKKAIKHVTKQLENPTNDKTVAPAKKSSEKKSKKTKIGVLLLATLALGAKTHKKTSSKSNTR